MPPEPVQLTPHLWVMQCRAMAYNTGVILNADHACLIDPGLYPDELATLAHFVQAQGAMVGTIVLTHSHWDHILGVQDFPTAEVLTQAQYLTLVRQYETELLHEVQHWYAQTSPVRAHLFRIPLPARTFEQTMSLTVGTLTWQLLHMPGHAADQCMLYHADTGTLWAADMLSDEEIPFVSDRLSAYEQSLQQVAALPVYALVPGHGTATTDPGDIQARLAADRAYLTNLHTTVDQAIRAGKTLAATVAACASITYRSPAANALPHRLNVEQVYVELGGKTDGSPVGWQPMM